MNLDLVLINIIFWNIIDQKFGGLFLFLKIGSSNGFRRKVFFFFIEKPIKFEDFSTI